MTREEEIIKASHLYAKHQQKPFMDGAKWADKHPILDEVKEVDLEKELKCLIGNVGQCDRKIAKHFFELGLKMKGE